MTLYNILHLGEIFHSCVGRNPDWHPPSPIGANLTSETLPSQRDAKIVDRRFIAGKASNNRPLVLEGRLILYTRNLTIQSSLRNGRQDRDKVSAYVPSPGWCVR
jgi:hypothetical protein